MVYYYLYIFDFITISSNTIFAEMKTPLYYLYLEKLLVVTDLISFIPQNHWFQLPRFYKEVILVTQQMIMKLITKEVGSIKTHVDTQTLIVSLYLYPSLFLFLSFCLYLSLSLSLSLSHTHTHTHILLLSLSISLTHSHTISSSQFWRLSRELPWLRETWNWSQAQPQWQPYYQV